MSKQNWSKPAKEKIVKDAPRRQNSDTLQFEKGVKNKIPAIAKPQSQRKLYARRKLSPISVSWRNRMASLGWPLFVIMKKKKTLQHHTRKKVELRVKWFFFSCIFMYIHHLYAYFASYIIGGHCPSGCLCTPSITSTINTTPSTTISQTGLVDVDCQHANLSTIPENLPSNISIL